MRRRTTCSPKAPPAPDLAGAATQQGAANQDAARLQTTLNRPNQNTPWGSQTWSQGPNDQWTSNISLDPSQQGLLDSSNRISQNLANVGEAGLSRVGNAQAQPFDTSGLPALSGAPHGSHVQGSLDTQGLQAIPGVNDFSADRQRVEDAVMSRQTPDFNRAEESMRQSLANQGITPGSDAWNHEYDTLNRAKVDARNQATLAGGQEQSRLFGLGSSARAQQFGERQAQGSFANTAAGQQFGQNLAGGQFGNQSRQQGIQEQSYLRNQPLNELNALRTGSQVNAPQFAQYNNAGTVAPAPIFGAAQGQYNAANNQYGQQTGTYNNMLGGLFQLGGTAMQVPW